MPVEPSPLSKEPLDKTIEAVLELKSVGAGNQTIDNALGNVNIPEKLQRTVKVLSKEFPPDYNASKYQQQLTYPSD